VTSGARRVPSGRRAPRACGRSSWWRVDTRCATRSFSWSKGVRTSSRRSRARPWAMSAHFVAAPAYMPTSRRIEGWPRVVLELARVARTEVGPSSSGRRVVPRRSRARVVESQCRHPVAVSATSPVGPYRLGHIVLGLRTVGG
jgi:hypothetical protein